MGRPNLGGAELEPPKDETPTPSRTRPSPENQRQSQQLAGLPDETYQAIRSGYITVASAVQQANRVNRLAAIVAKNEGLPDKRYAVIHTVAAR